MGLFDPLFELVYIETVLIGLEGCLEGHIKDPVLLLAASPDKIYRFACLQNLVCQMVRQERRDHHVV